MVIPYPVAPKWIDLLGMKEFLDCIFDEGHLIKNKNAKLSIAVNTLCARHRLRLSGTPSQNNVTELWALMDFLVPGFLGTREAFGRCYEPQIKKMFMPMATEKETKVGEAALGHLHQQILLFIVRRLKGDALAASAESHWRRGFRYDCTQRRIFDREIRREEGPRGDVDEHTFTRTKRQRNLCIHSFLVDPTCPRDMLHSAKFTELRKLLLSRLGFGGGNRMVRNQVSSEGCKLHRSR
jgi:TATA-binding protein-associated factor